MSKEIVLTVLKNSGKPMKTAEIAAAAGLDKKEVEKAIKALKSEEKIFSPKNCFYQAK
ncbi:MAG: MarR family transcriptional regulator [Bacteroidales bacterium]